MERVSTPVMRRHTSITKASDVGFYNVSGSPSLSSIGNSSFDDLPDNDPASKEPRHQRSPSNMAATVISIATDSHGIKPGQSYRSRCCSLCSYCRFRLSCSLYFLFLLVLTASATSYILYLNNEMEIAKSQRIEALQVAAKAEEELEQLKQSMQKESDFLKDEFRQHEEKMKEEAQQRVNELESARRKLSESEAMEKEMKMTIEKLKNAIEESKKLADGNTKTNNNNDEEFESLKKKALSRIRGLENWLKDMAKMALHQRYGNGPARIRMETSKGTIVIETAPFDVLPVTVWYFLEKVEKGFWNGASFHRNLPHVIQLGMVNKAGQAIAYEKGPSNSLAFQEYDPSFPATLFTLGFQGRPSGPEFYINTKDNKEAHGPGGQRPSFELPGEGIFADVTFAKIIEGEDIVREIKASPTALFENGYQLEERVEVSKLQILT